MAAESEIFLRLGMQPQDARFHAEVRALQHCRVSVQSVYCSSTACNEHCSHSYASDATDTARHIGLTKDGESASPKSLVHAQATVMDFLLTQVHSQHLLNGSAKQQTCIPFAA